MKVVLLDLRKYPFLKPLSEELKKYAGGVTLNDLLSEGSYYLEQAKTRVEKILKDEEVESYEKIKDPVLVFYTTMYLITALNSELLKNKFLEKESKIITKNLSLENEETLLEISKLLGLRINQDKIELKIEENRKTLPKIFNYSVNFIDYLRYTKSLRRDNEKFSLATHILKDGKVYISKEEVVEILVHYIRDRLDEMMNITDIAIPEQIKKLADELRGRKTPPCIVELIRKESLNAEELSIIATYFLDIGEENTAKSIIKDENVINKFKGDKKTKYIIYSCKRMKELRLCVNSCNVQNPLQLYYGKLE